MRFRKLRIAWSVVCGVACVLLIALWVRSYWRQELFGVGVTKSSYVSVTWYQGNLTIAASRVSLPTVFESRTSNFYQMNNQTWTYRFRSVPYFEAFAIVPHWFAAILFIPLAAIPWIPGRFSLRTLLIVLTLVAVVLGLILAVVRW